MEYSAGILCFRIENDKIEFFVCHSGGPYNLKKDIWGIPKGRKEANENSFLTAIREFEEETGVKLPTYDINSYIDLGSIKQNKNKNIHIYAIKWDDFDLDNCKSNLCEIEFPYGSGHKILIPEIDRYEWKTYEEIISKCVVGQRFFFDLIQNLHEDNK